MWTGAAIALLATGTRANAVGTDQVQLASYIHARAAATLGAPDRASRDYSASMASAPGNQIVAASALRHALAAGQLDLAVKAARTLEQQNVTTPDVRLVLLTDAIRSGAWSEANRNTDELAKDQVFSFLAPVLRSWIAVGSRQVQPLSALAVGNLDPLAASYVAEHRPLILLALGQEKEGLIAVRNRVEGHDTRSSRLALAAAARLAREGRKQDALAVLTGEEPIIVASRAWLQKHDRLPGEIATPAQGVAEFFLRIAIDLRRQDVGSLALSFARLSTFLDPDYSGAWLVTSELLASQDMNQQALDVLGNIPAADPAADLVNDFRINLLAATGAKEVAIKQAEKEARKGRQATDWERLGDLYSQLDRYGDSAAAYRRALDARDSGAGARPKWALWLLLGGALDRSGQWKDAKAALESAYQLAPNEPLVLNYLGYAQLERRENLDAAMKLITEANRLQPDSAQITDSLGWAHYLQGDYASAVALLERAVQGEPTDAAINEHLGDAYYSSGRRYEARYAWSAALLSADNRGDAARLRSKIDDGLKPELVSP